CRGGSRDRTEARERASREGMVAGGGGGARKPSAGTLGRTREGVSEIRRRADARTDAHKAGARGERLRAYGQAPASVGGGCASSETSQTVLGWERRYSRNGATP